MPGTLQGVSGISPVAFLVIRIDCLSGLTEHESTMALEVTRKAGNKGPIFYIKM